MVAQTHDMAFGQERQEVGSTGGLGVCDETGVMRMTRRWGSWFARMC
jgi:hypothetical protein